MAWIDDRIWCHGKLLALSDRAYRVYVNALAYSSGMGTKGVLILAQQKLLGATAPVRSELVGAGLWDELDEQSVVIHDWDEHNGRRDARRIADRERQRRWRDSQRDQTRDVTRDTPSDTPRDRRTLKEVKEVKKEPNGSFASERVRNPVWDALVEVFGEPSTETARTLRGKVVRSLTAAGATHAEVLARARTWPRHFEGATLTESALEKHWDALGRKPLRMGQR